MHTEYLFEVYFTLEDPNRILQNPRIASGMSDNFTVRVPASSVNDEMNGGLGMSDIHPLLKRGDDTEAPADIGMETTVLMAKLRAEQLGGVYGLLCQSPIL